MKFKLVETFIEGYGRGIQNNPSSEQIEQCFMQNGVFIDNNFSGKFGHSYFIFPSGTVFASDCHENMTEILERCNIVDNYEEYCYPLTHGNCIRCCDIDEYENYIELPTNKLTSEQYNKIEDFIDKNQTKFDHIVINLDEDFTEVIYHYNEYITGDIIKRIKRYYSSGILYENIELNESKQVGLLYRFCNIYDILTILKENKLKSYNYTNISFTRDANTSFSYVGMQPRSIFRLVLDGDKLSDNYKIKPVADKYTSRDYKDKYYRNEEREERVESPINNIDRYIYSIDIILDKFEQDGLNQNKLQDDSNTFTYPYTVKEVSDIIHNISNKFKLRLFLNNKELTIEELKNYNLW